MEQKTEEVWPNKSIEELAIDALWNIANYRIDIGPQMTAQSMRFTAADELTMISEARAALKAQPAPTEAEQGEDSARLDWSSEQAPSSECSYHHVTAQTPFGRILITWKGWKDYPSPTVDEHPIDGYFYVGDDVADAKENAERAYFEAINRARASAETGGVKP